VVQPGSQVSAGAAPGRNRSLAGKLHVRWHRRPVTGNGSVAAFSVVPAGSCVLAGSVSTNRLVTGEILVFVGKLQVVESLFTGWILRGYEEASGG